MVRRGTEAAAVIRSQNGGTLEPWGRCKPIPKSSGVDHHRHPMIKSLVAFSIFALLGASVIALPSFAPHAEASEPAALIKGDKLDSRPASLSCSQQTWPNLETSCLRNGVSGTVVHEARLVTARR
jgi:hypothetical protein